MSKFKQKTIQAVKFIQSYINRIWYAPLLGVLAALDNFIVVIPNDGLLISSAMLTPKKWIRLSFCVALGSTVGAAVLAWAIHHYGLNIVEELYPGIQSTKMWTWTHDFFQQYGLWLLFLVAVTPFVQQPAIIFAVIAEFSILQIAIVVFIGRLIKFLLMSYIGSHAPHLLSKFWGLDSELEEVGLKSKK